MVLVRLLRFLERIIDAMGTRIYLAQHLLEEDFDSDWSVEQGVSHSKVWRAALAWNYSKCGESVSFFLKERSGRYANIYLMGMATNTEVDVWYWDTSKSSFTCNKGGIDDCVVGHVNFPLLPVTTLGNLKCITFVIFFKRGKSWLADVRVLTIDVVLNCLSSSTWEDSGIFWLQRK